MGSSQLLFQNQELYGGAISTVIPTGLLDASQLRQVPDTQEVFVNLDNAHLDKEDSLIFDLLEQVKVTAGANEADNDDKAIQVHLDELSQLNGLSGKETWKLLSTQEVSIDKSKINSKDSKSNPNVKSYVSVATSPVAKWGKDPKWLVLVLGLIRYHEHETDILVSLNLPSLHTSLIDSLQQIVQLSESESKEAISVGEDAINQRIKNGVDIVVKALKSFTINDHDLFGV